MAINGEIKEIKAPRETVEVHLSDGRVLSGPRGSTLAVFLRILPEWQFPPIVGAVVDGDLRELTLKIEKDVVVKPITMVDSDGSKIYRRSLTFLLETAFEDLFPDEYLIVDYSVPNGGYFCRLLNRSPFTLKELDLLGSKMHKIVDADIPFIREKVSKEEAVEYFKEKKYLDKVRLLKYRKKPFLILYRLEDHRDYHHGYMVPTSGYLKWFNLIPQPEGFLLQYPRRKTPTELFQMPEYSKLLEEFKYYGDWLTKLGIDSVGSLNETIENGSVQEVILVSEAHHDQKLVQIARQISEQIEEKKVVLIAGPSSSGKTTFSKRLAIQLLALGISPFALEMDNYFVDRENTPRDGEGNLDFESFEAIDHNLLQLHLKEIIEGREVVLPLYNFKTGKREVGEKVKLEKDQIVIIEGIHGLNPNLLPRIKENATFRIYISCLTQLNLDRYNRISTTDTRMLRRIVRDANSRGYTAQRTIQMWESVRRGERLHIFPYQENANVLFNSALVYELSALKPFADPLLRQIPHGTDEFLEAKRLLSILDWFLPIQTDLVPDNSILREFVGGSILKDFRLWENVRENQ
jgi:uridine kinase